MSSDEQVTPGTGWFEMGKAKAFLNNSLISLGIIIGGAVLSGVEHFFSVTIGGLDIPSDVKSGLLALNIWIASRFRDIVFPTPTKIKD